MRNITEHNLLDVNIPGKDYRLQVARNIAFTVHL